MNWIDHELFNWRREPCSAPQVCRVNTAGPGVAVSGADGCFDPTAYCPSVGYKACNRAASTKGALVQLYECTLRASDQTLQWSVTDCGQLVPPHTCYANVSSGATACVEVVENCPPATPPRCDGNAILHCILTINDKAVWDWYRVICEPTGTVCRVGQYGGFDCVHP